jgi:hypothetical protein
MLTATDIYFKYIRVLYLLICKVHYLKLTNNYYQVIVLNMLSIVFRRTDFEMKF